VRLHCNVVERPHVLDDVQLEAAALVGLEVKHVPNRAVGNGRAEHRNLVLVAPVVHRLFVVDFLAQAVDELGRSPGQLAVAFVLIYVAHHMRLCKRHTNY